MKIETVSNKRNQLMGREEAELRINHQGQRTPSREEISKAVAGHLKMSENQIIIDRIITLQGQAVSSVKALAYEKAGTIPAYKLEKMKRRVKAAKPEEPAGAKAEE